MDGPSSFGAEELLADLNWVRSLARSLLRDPGAGDDVAQEAWLAALRRDERPSRAWLAGTVRNLAARWWRDQSRRGRRERAAARAEAVPSTEAVIEKSELQQVVGQEVLRLDEPYRSTLLLRYQEELAPDRIAERQGIPADTVRWRLRRGRELLRERFERRMGPSWQRSLFLVALPSLGEQRPGDGLAAAGGSSLTLPLGILGAALGVLGVLAGALWLAGDVGAADRGLEPLGVAPAALPHTDVARPPAPGARVVTLPSTPDTLAEDPTPEPTVADAPECVLTGRVVDDAGATIAGATVRLTTLHWARRAVTDELGRFRLETDLPEGHSTVRIDADPFHGRAVRTVGAGRGFDLAPFVRGEQHIGTFTLGAAGVVGGRVREPSGEPLPASIRLLSEAGLAGKDLRTRTRADALGTYELRSVPPGAWRLEFQLPGRLTRSYPLEVRAGEAVTLDATLEPGPRVEGVVVDEAGEPLAGARLFPLAELREWSVLSDEDGRFSLHLPSEEAHVLQARLAGYELDLRRRIRIRPGDSDVRVVLRRVEDVTFRVVDGGTGEPLTFFGLAVERDGTAERPGQPVERIELRLHEDGLIVRAARPGDWVSVVAPNYLDARFRVRGGSQELALARGASVTGRILSAGRPVSSTEVRVMRREPFLATSPLERIVRAPGRRVRPDVHALDPEPPELDPAGLPGEYVTYRTDGEGCFRLSGLTAGGWLLMARPPRGDGAAAPVVIDFDVEDERETALGDLELPRAARVRGRVRLASGAPLEGHRVAVEGVPSVLTDASGSFTLTNVPPGGQWLALEPALTVLAAPQLYFVRLSAGEEREVELVVDDAEAVEVHLDARLGGAPLSGLHTLRIVPTREPASAFTLTRRFDVRGELTAVLPELGTARVELVLDGAHLPAGAPIDLRPEAKSEKRLDFAAGAIELRFSDALDLSRASAIAVRLRSSGAASGGLGEPWTLLRGLDKGYVVGSDGILTDDSRDGRILIEPVPAGTLDVNVLLVEGEAEVAIPGGSFRALRVDPAGVTPLHLR